GSRYDKLRERDASELPDGFGLHPVAKMNDEMFLRPQSRKGAVHSGSSRVCVNHIRVTERPRASNLDGLLQHPPSERHNPRNARV
ncbi:hypothetical protein R0K19_23625, partial [Bacillus sp. SIMBA_161]